MQNFKKLLLRKILCVTDLKVKACSGLLRQQCVQSELH